MNYFHRLKNTSLKATHIPFSILPNTTFCFYTFANINEVYNTEGDHDSHWSSEKVLTVLDWVGTSDSWWLCNIFPGWVCFFIAPFRAFADMREGGYLLSK